MSSMPVKIYLNLLFSFSIYIGMLSAQPASEHAETWEKNGIWKAGVSRAVITPPEYMWMAGFAARDKPADGTLHDLWVKALALEDGEGKRALLITADVIGFDRNLSQAICDLLVQTYALSRTNIILSSSHTHSGPVMNENLRIIYPELDSMQIKKILHYREFITNQILLAAGRAIEGLAPAYMSSGVGIARFAVNRRESGWQGDILYDPDVKGPSDHVVEVLKVHDPGSGFLKAVVFGYGCHATCLSLNQWSGDWPGFAQIALEHNYPGLTAMFFTGFGADQNPIPRGEVLQAEQYGKELAVAVEKVIKEPGERLKATLNTRYSEIELDLAPAPGLQELDQIIEDGAEWEKRWARLTKEKLLAGEDLPGTYPFYPVQTWQLGRQTLVMLGGEVVVDYAFRLRNIFGNELMVMGYANDVMAYIPSERILEEGGYEGESSMRAYGHRGTWLPGIEEKIVKEVIRQIDSINDGLTAK